MGGNLGLKWLFPSIYVPIVYAQHWVPTLQVLLLPDYRAIGGAMLV